MTSLVVDFSFFRLSPLAGWGWIRLLSILEIIQRKSLGMFRTCWTVDDALFKSVSELRISVSRDTHRNLIFAFFVAAIGGSAVIVDFGSKDESGEDSTHNKSADTQ
jgi:hypothetical protein